MQVAARATGRNRPAARAPASPPRMPPAAWAHSIQPIGRLPACRPRVTYTANRVSIMPSPTAVTVRKIPIARAIRFPVDRAQSLGQFAKQPPGPVIAAVGPVPAGDQRARRGGDREGAGVQDGRAAQPQRGRDQAAGRRAGQPADPVAEAVQRVRGGQLARRDQARHQRVLGRAEELGQRRLGERHRDHDRKPARRIGREQGQQRQRLHHVDHHDDPAPVPPVDIGASDGTEQQAGQEAGQHDAGDGGRRTGQPEHVDRQRDAQRPVSGDRDRPGRPEQAEVALAQGGYVHRRHPWARRFNAASS